MQKKLDAYRGKLSPSEIAQGINVARENSRRLLEDSETLLKAGRFPSAASLAILSIEEGEKGSILRGLALVKTDSELLSAWKNYRTHTKKNVGWILPDLVISGARKIEDFRPIFDTTSDHPFVLDQLKQLGFYTDCLGKKHWVMPTDIVSESLAKKIVEIARKIAPTTEITAREIELWIEYVGPVFGKDLSQMKQALINWYSAMQKEGLEPEGDNVMAKFMS